MDLPPGHGNGNLPSSRRQGGKRCGYLVYRGAVKSRSDPLGVTPGLRHQILCWIPGIWGEREASPGWDDQVADSWRLRGSSDHGEASAAASLTHWLKFRYRHFHSIPG